MGRATLTAPAGGIKPVAAYSAMIVVTILAFLLVDAFGTHLVAPGVSDGPHPGTPAPGPDTHVFAHVLLALLAVIVGARLLGALFRRLQQPPVIGEVVAGI